MLFNSIKLKYKSILSPFNPFVKYPTPTLTPTPSKTLQLLYDNLTSQAKPIEDHPNISIMPPAISNQLKICDNLLKTYENEENKEKEILNNEIERLLIENVNINNKLLKLNGNIKVYVNIEPITETDINLIEYNNDNNSITIINIENKEKEGEYNNNNNNKFILINVSMII